MNLATCHGARSAAIQFRGIFGVGLFLLPLVSVATAKYSGGSGTAQDPYRIATAADLITLGETPADYDKHFILTADLDLDPKLPGRKVFDRAVIGPGPSTPFRGVLDGDGHTIAHLTITGGRYLGLFGCVESGAEVRDVRVVDVNVASSEWNVGGLVGYNGGSVTECYSTGAVSGYGVLGGLVGFNWGTMIRCSSTCAVGGLQYGVGGLVGDCEDGSVTQCHSTGPISGRDCVGGLVGVFGSCEGGTRIITQCYSTGTVSGRSNVGGLVGGFGGIWGCGGLVTHCYSTGNVSGDSHVGGLVGSGFDTPAYCYSTGAVRGKSYVSGLGPGDMTCFWDIQTSGQVKSAGGTGKTTAQMQTAKTFLDAGWDFVGETVNGTEDIWTIVEGKDYPKLAWKCWAAAPFPPSGALNVVRTPILRWRVAPRAVAHDVYFGEDENAVAHATPVSLGVYRGRLLVLQRYRNVQ